MIVVIDYDMGNVHSVSNALKAVGCDVKISRRAGDIKEADKLVLPGVGAFAVGMKNLDDFGLVSLLNEEVLVKKKPILGICLGLQLFAKKSHEGGEHNGLGWVEGEVKKLVPNDQSLKIPHVGWNDVEFKKDCPLFSNIDEHPNFYFVHSYYFDCDDGLITSKFDYGGKFTASIRKDNIFGTQFHPEKSQNNGLKVLKNFAGEMEC